MLMQIAVFKYTCVATGSQCQSKLTTSKERCENVELVERILWKPDLIAKSSLPVLFFKHIAFLYLAYVFRIPENRNKQLLTSQNAIRTSRCEVDI